MLGTTFKFRLVKLEKSLYYQNLVQMHLLTLSEHRWNAEVKHNGRIGKVIPWHYGPLNFILTAHRQKRFPLDIFTEKSDNT